MILGRWHKGDSLGAKATGAAEVAATSATAPEKKAGKINLSPLFFAFFFFLF